MASRPEPRRFVPTPFLSLSAGLHLAGAAALLVGPRLWPWVLTGVLLDHLAMGLAGCWPRSRLLGPNLTALDPSRTGAGTVALTLDDGPDPINTPRVLELLEQGAAKATFFCIGRRAEQHPELVKEIVQRGHSVQNHSHTHSYGFAFFGPRRLARELDQAQTVLGQLTGTTPSLFRAPVGFRSPLLEPLLARRGLQLVSWTRRGYDALQSNPDRILRRLLHGLAEGDILVLHDGRMHRSSSSGAPVLEVLPALLEALDRRQLRSVALTAASIFH